MVAALARRVATVPAGEITRRFDNGVYDVLPIRWRAVTDAAEQLGARFEQLADFYRLAARAGQGILAYMA